ncbi:MAG: amidohydrolase family protein, partial [Firmicutes bacterium]|nr:amidohydrolase family protein [Bacillota bacterium]
MSILIRNGQLLLEKRDTYCLEVGDIRIEDGVIQNIAKTLVPKQEEKIIDASGKFVAPGLIDLHVHLREPGREDKETIVSGAKAGAAGGFTTIVCMPNTEPPLDSGPMISAIYSRALEAPIRVIPVGCVSKG